MTQLATIQLPARSNRLGPGGGVSTPFCQPAATVRPAKAGRRRGGAEHDPARRLFDHGGVLAGRALRAGIERLLREGDGVGQRDARLGHVDREGPAGAGRVPIELVEFLEIADLARGAIFDDIFVRPGLERDVGASDAHTHAVRKLLGGEGFAFAVAGDRLNIEADHDAPPAGAGIGGWKIAQDAAADLVAFGLDHDSLGDLQIAAALDRHVADEAENALGRPSRTKSSAKGGREHEKGNADPSRHGHGEVSPIDLGRGCAPGRWSTRLTQSLPTPIWFIRIAGRGGVPAVIAANVIGLDRRCIHAVVAGKAGPTSRALSICCGVWVRALRPGRRGVWAAIQPRSTSL
ncbi:MAG TPA: hypothetical protein VIY51_22430 [Xanthobacteraceae bacterium]